MSRESIYYWKCDRESAFRAVPQPDREAIERPLSEAIRDQLDDQSASLEPFAVQGNHLAWLLHHAEDKRTSFVRVETGPEGDDYLEVESFLLDAVRSRHVPTPQVVGCDATRRRTPFAWQVIDYLKYPNLQHWHKRGELDLPALGAQLGRAIASFQQVPVSGYGPFRTDVLREQGQLAGYHSSYRDYFHLNLARHLAVLVESSLLSRAEGNQITDLIAAQDSLLDIGQPCLVHKDMAFWNLLGTRDRLAAVIDWDDAIAGDPVDDLALLGCFLPQSFLGTVLAGYQSIQPIPAAFAPRFWLHVLRNLLFKAVIRLRGGYFEKNDDFFLIRSGATGGDLREETLMRLREAITQLKLFTA